MPESFFNKFAGWDFFKKRLFKRIPPVAASVKIYPNIKIQVENIVSLPNVFLISP